MSLLKNSLVLLFFCQSYWCIAQENLPQKVTNDSLVAYAQTVIEEYKIPGLQVALVSDEQIVNLAAVGVRKLGGSPLATTDYMHLGSCGKAMTGYLAAVLVEEEYLSWSTTLKEVFPEWSSRMQPAYRNASLQDVLSHQSLLPPFVDLAAWETLALIKGKTPRKRRSNFVKWVVQQTVIPFDSSDLAAGHRYSNAGYAVAAAMLEKVMDQSWEELMDTWVFTPMKIEARMGWPAKANAQQPFGHQVDTVSGILKPHAPDDSYQIDPILSPAGNISMSIGDYARFIQWQLKGLHGSIPGFDKAFFEFLHYGNQPDSEYAIGWYGVDQFADQVSSHTGSADTFYCLNILLRKHNFAVIVIANAATEETKAGAEKVRNFLLRPYLID